MSCDCDKADFLPSCIDTLIIGEVSDGSLNYWVYLKTPDGRIDKYDAVDVVYTNLIGIENPQVRVGTQYEIWVTTNNAANINQRVDFIPNGETEASTCVLVEFLPCYEGDEDNEFVSQSISLE